MAPKTSLLGLLPSSINNISFNLVDTRYSIRGKISLKNWIQLAINKEHKTLGDISFNICSDNYLLDINNKHLNHNYYTDIITFDFCEESIVSGDIYISIDRVRENARTEKKTLRNEFCRVIIHGVLHLCGYKDKKPADARRMREKEDYYLSLLGE